MVDNCYPSWKPIIQLNEGALIYIMDLFSYYYYITTKYNQ